MYLSKEVALEVVSAVASNVEVYEFKDQLTLIVPKEDIVKVATELRDNPKTKFDQLRDVTAIDWLRSSKRFEVVYFFYSNSLLHRLRIKVASEIDDLNVPSIVSVYDSADWYERETYDMYGINFTNHPDLRRFYMPEDYVDPDTGDAIYPLRKDFPLMGIPDSLPLPPYPEKYGEVK